MAQCFEINFNHELMRSRGAAAEFRRCGAHMSVILDLTEAVNLLPGQDLTIENGTIHPFLLAGTDFSIDLDGRIVRTSFPNAGGPAAPPHP
jgi:hypothetical protein